MGTDFKRDELPLSGLSANRPGLAQEIYNEVGYLMGRYIRRPDPDHVIGANAAGRSCNRAAPSRC